MRATATVVNRRRTAHRRNGIKQWYTGQYQVVTSVAKGMFGQESTVVRCSGEMGWCRERQEYGENNIPA